MIIQIIEFDAPFSVTEGEPIEVDYTVRNTGDLADTQDIEFSVDGSSEGTESDVTLGGGDTESNSFTYVTGSGDVPEVTVEVSTDDDSASPDVMLEEEDDGEPNLEGETVETAANMSTTVERENTGDGEATGLEVTDVDTLLTVDESDLHDTLRAGG